MTVITRLPLNCIDREMFVNKCRTPIIQYEMSSTLFIAVMISAWIPTTGLAH